MKHLHIGYGDSAADCLNEAIKNHGLPGDRAIPLRDDFTQGPLPKSMDIVGFQTRISYWESINAQLNFRSDVHKFYMESIALLQNLQADQITIWVGDSCHDQLATAWLLSLMKKKKSSWQMIDLSKLPKTLMPNEEAVVNVALYTPDQLKALYPYHQSLTNEKVEAYAHLWDTALKANSAYRIKENNELRSVNRDYFDAYILSFLSSEFQPMGKVIGNILRDGTYRLSDTTIEWNIRKMIRDKRIEYQGTLSSFKDYTIRIK